MPENKKPFRLIQKKKNCLHCQHTENRLIGLFNRRKLTYYIASSVNNSENP